MPANNDGDVPGPVMRDCDGTLEEMFAMEQKVAPVLATSHDCHEGVAAFMERRTAQFEGK